MTRAKDKNKAGKGTRKCRGMDVPISHKVAKESLTEKMIFEQKPEVKDRENHSRIQIHIFLTEKTSTKAL
jgi:hypothetical protein